MDENDRLILHGFDVIRHAFNGGTHPIDIPEALRVKCPSPSLGYGLTPKRPVPETRVRMVREKVAPGTLTGRRLSP